MAKTAKITLELNYNQADLEYMRGDTLTDEEFEAYVKEQSVEDILYYMRTEDIDKWAEVEFSNEA